MTLTATFQPYADLPATIVRVTRPALGIRSSGRILSNSSHTGDYAREPTTRVVTGTDNSRQGNSPGDETW
jgi:hypothetical protein